MAETEEVREMRTAETVLNIIRDSRNRLLESRVTRKSVKRGSGRGGWKRAEYFSTSLAAYSTARTVLRGGVAETPLPYPTARAGGSETRFGPCLPAEVVFPQSARRLEFFPLQ
jgi:hypothetical protein